MISFPVNENRFSFIFWLQTIYKLASCVQIPKAIRAFCHVWKWHIVQRVRSEMRRCTTHALYRSKLWQQDHCQHHQNKNPDGSTLEGTAQRIGWPFGDGGEEGHIMPPHIFEVGLKVSTNEYLDVMKSVVIPWCNQVAGGRPWMWQQDSAPAHKSKETQACLQKECYDFQPFSHWPPHPPTLTHWIIRFGHTSRISPTWPPTTPKPAWSPPSTEYSPRCRWRLWKRHAISSGYVSRRWLKLKVATLNRGQLYYIIKLHALILSIQILK